MNGRDPLNLVLDTTFLLPAFGVEIDVDTSEKIELAIQQLVKESSTPIRISDLSPLEGFLKSYRLAEKAKNEEGKKAAKMGFLAVTRDSSWLRMVPHTEEIIVNAAFEIRLTHNDPFDCFIFATAKATGARLVTEDSTAKKYLGSENVLSWEDLKRSLRSKRHA